jgi:hypothetical protein
MIFKEIKELYKDTFENLTISNKKLLIAYLPIIGLLILINIILSVNFAGDAYGLDGSLVESNSPEMKKSIIVTYLFFFQLLGFIIGLILSLIPFKGLKYSQKYLRVSLYSIFALHFMMMVIIINRFLIR